MTPHGRIPRPALEAAFSPETRRAGLNRPADPSADARPAAQRALIAAWGFEPPAEGTHVLNVDLAAIVVPALHGNAEGAAKPDPVIRLGFAKRDETLDAGVERLAAGRG